jgi:hypothetical protein
MGINFPSRPPTGQKFPDPALPNLPVWQWNGTAWVQISGGGGGGGSASSITFAPGGNISATDVQAAILELDTEKAPLASPALSGNPTAPTPTAGDNDTSIATTAFVTSAVAGVTVVPPATVAPIMDSVAAVGTTTKYAREDHVHPSDTSRAALTQVVRYDTAQTLTSETPPYGTTVTQRAQARSNIYAAPLDSLSFSGMQINGSGDVSQERGNVNFTAAAGTYYHIQDGWKFYYVSAPLSIVFYPQYQISGNMPPGLPNCVLISPVTGKASLAATDQIVIDHMIEGYRVARLAWGTTNAQPLSIGFWVWSAIPGTMAVSVINGTAFNRSYISNVVINAATTWEFKILTIPGDTVGTWTKDNTLGLFIRFCFGVGSSSTIQGPAGSWQGTAYSGSAATTNFMATTGNSCGITGLIVLPGIELPSQARSALIMRPYGQELMTCKRYYEKNPDYVTAARWSGYAVSGVTFYATVYFGTVKRATPTVTLVSSGGSNFANVSGGATSSTDGFYEARAANGTGAGTFSSDWVADARL